MVMDILDYIKAEIESAEIQATKYQSYGHAESYHYWSGYIDAMKNVQMMLTGEAE